jgi:hypothetical protein
VVDREVVEWMKVLDEDQDEDEAGDISGAGDEGARAFTAVVGNPPKPDSPVKPVEEVQDPLQSKTPDDTQANQNQEEAEESISCLIDRLFSCTIDLLFCAGFTVPESVRGVDGDKINVSLSFFSPSFTHP